MYKENSAVIPFDYSFWKIFIDDPVVNVNYQLLNYLLKVKNVPEGRLEFDQKVSE